MRRFGWACLDVGQNGEGQTQERSHYNFQHGNTHNEKEYIAEQSADAVEDPQCAIRQNVSENVAAVQRRNRKQVEDAQGEVE